ncbi:hypothetical protein DL769_005635 [Monosporascus sp. CRB-8-3]|nr:hypothetical protein DL769_005635 [Monosporascus sp. CRB-8-3]
MKFLDSPLPADKRFNAEDAIRTIFRKRWIEKKGDWEAVSISGGSLGDMPSIAITVAEAPFWPATGAALMDKCAEPGRLMLGAEAKGVQDTSFIGLLRGARGRRRRQESWVRGGRGRRSLLLVSRARG